MNEITLIIGCIIFGASVGFTAYALLTASKRKPNQVVISRELAGSLLHYALCQLKILNACSGHSVHTKNCQLNVDELRKAMGEV